MIRDKPLPSGWKVQNHRLWRHISLKGKQLLNVILVVKLSAQKGTWRHIWFHKDKSLLDCNEGDFETQNEKVLDVHKTEEHKAAKVDLKAEI